MTWFSLKDFFAELTIKIKGVKMKRRPYTLPSRMLWLLLGLLPLLAYSFFEMSYFGLGERLSVFSYFGNGLSYGLGIIALLSIIATAYTVIFAVVSSKNKEAYSGKRFRKKLLFILLIALLLISLFLPVISITVRGGTKIDSPTQNVKFGVADLFATDKADMKYYRGTTSASMAEEIKATIKSLFSKKGTADTEMMLNDLIFGVDRNNVSAIYVAIQAMTYVVLGFIGLLLSLTFSATWYNSGCVGKIRAAKIFLGLSAIALIVLEGVLLVIANMAISGELMYLMSVGLGIGIALMLVCVVGIFTVRVEADVSGSYMDTWYDNADVTYAPYVIK